LPPLLGISWGFNQDAGSKLPKFMPGECWKCREVAGNDTQLLTIKVSVLDETSELSGNKASPRTGVLLMAASDSTKTSIRLCAAGSC
jgi:hypothetical protein